MPTHETVEGSTCQATHAWLEVGSKRIAMLGVTSHTSPKPGAFNGATIEDPWATLQKWTPRLHEEGADLVYPVWKSNFGCPTPSARSCLRSCVYSMAWSFHAIDAIT